MTQPLPHESGPTRPDGAATGVSKGESPEGVARHPHLQPVGDGTGPGAADPSAVGEAATQRIEALEAQVCGLRDRQVTAATIEQAKGILMACYGISADSAFAVLRRRSQETNVKLRDVAAGLVAAVARASTHPFDAVRRVLGSAVPEVGSATVADHDRDDG